MINPRVTDNDAGEISVTLNDKELRGWSYKDDGERRTKMLAAREYVEGWCDGGEARNVSQSPPTISPQQMAVEAELLAGLTGFMLETEQS